MSLKTSFFNKAVLKSDLKRFWWVGILETIIIFLTNTLPLWYRVSGSGYAISSTAYDVGRLITWQNAQFLILCVFAVSVVALAFSYMHQVASVSFYHSIPVERKKLLLTKISSSLVLTIVPILINALIIFGIVSTSEISLVNGYSSIFKWVYTGILYTILMLGLATLVNMMTGNPIGTIVFTVGFIFIPLMLVAFYEYFCSNEVFGFYWNNSYDILEWIYITEKNLLKLSYALVYILMTVVFYCLAFLLYKKRKLEMYGEVIAFKGLVPVFIGIISIIASMAGYSYFGQLFGGNNIFYLIPLGILGTVIAWMISRKSISTKGIMKPILIYIISSLCLIGFVKFDISGFEGRIPDSDDVEWVNVMHDDNAERYIWVESEKIPYKEKGKMDTKFYDIDDIENVIAMHRYALGNREKRNSYSILPITYKLKNGRTITRQYRYSFELDKDILMPVFETKEVRAKRFELVNGSKKTFKEAAINDRRVKESVVFYKDNENLNLLAEAVQKDLSEISYDEIMLSKGGSINITLDYNFEIEAEYEGTVDENAVSKYTNRSESVAINENYKHTMKFLGEIGYISKIPTADDVVFCRVEVWTNGVPADAIVEKSGVVVDTELYGKNSGTEISDRGEIETLWNLYENIITDRKYTDYNNCVNVRVLYNLGDHEFEASCSYDYDKLPDYFKKFM